MTSLLNPYESPLERSEAVVDTALTVSNASVLWFVGASFVVNAGATICQSTARGQPFPWTFWSIAGLSVFAGVLAIVSLAVYGLVNLIFKRRCPATRLSRITAGVVFSSVGWIGLLVALSIGFKGPPGIFSLPVAAAASTFVDRKLARLAQRMTESRRTPELTT